MLEAYNHIGPKSIEPIDSKYCIDDTSLGFHQSELLCTKPHTLHPHLPCLRFLKACRTDVDEVRFRPWSCTEVNAPSRNPYWL